MSTGPICRPRARTPECLRCVLCPPCARSTTEGLLAVIHCVVVRFSLHFPPARSPLFLFIFIFLFFCAWTSIQLLEVTAQQQWTHRLRPMEQLHPWRMLPPASSLGTG